MKKLIVLLVLVTPFIAFGQSMPYTATFSSNFKIDSKYVEKVLNAWKSFEDNKLDPADPVIADTIHAEMADGSKINGKQAFFDAVKQLRSSISDLKVSMDAYMGVKSVDKNADFVLIWAVNSFTRDGQKIVQDIHQVWGFNKAGQVDFFKDFSGGNSMGTPAATQK